MTIAGSERLSTSQFQSIAKLVQNRVGIQLPPGKRTMVEGRLRKRVRALGLASLDAYGAHIADEGNLAQEFNHLVDCITTNKTDFFREPAHFDFLRDHAVPGLLQSRGREPLKIWSAACSIGAEAYTIAMVLADMQKGGRRFDYALLGTDISSEVLAAAAAAIYPAAMLDPVPPAMRERYVMVARDAARADVRIVPELRRRAQFHQINLMDEQYRFDRDVDVIFCRNVLIYFDKATQKAVLRRLASHLRPGGFLILGHSESMAGGEQAGLRQIMSTVFQA